MYKTFTSKYLTTGSRVKAAKEIIQFSKSKMAAVCYGPNFLLKYLIGRRHGAESPVQCRSLFVRQSYLSPFCRVSVLSLFPITQWVSFFGGGAFFLWINVFFIISLWWGKTCLLRDSHERRLDQIKITRFVRIHHKTFVMISFSCHCQCSAHCFPLI